MRTAIRLFTLAFLLCSISVSAHSTCNLSIISKATGFMNRGLSQKKIKNVISDRYSESELKQLRKDEINIIDGTYAIEQGASRRLIYNAPGISKQLNRVADRLLKAWPHEKPRFEILVTSATAYGPLTSQDQKILMPAGFISNATSEDEIAFILAHELSHALLLHASKISKTQQTSEILRKFYKNIGETLLLPHRLDLEDSERDRDDKIHSTKEMAFSYYEHAKELMTEFIHPSWQKSQEDEADLLAIELFLRAGYSLEGVNSAFQNMAAIEESACMDLEQFQQRMDDFVNHEIENLLEAPIAQESLDLRKQAFDGILKTSRKEVRKTIQKYALPKSHRPYDKRLEYILEFAERPQLSEYYDAALDREQSKGVLKTIQGSTEFKNLVSFTNNSKLAKIQLEDGDIQKATQSISKLSMNNQYGRILKYQLRRHQGRDGDAQANLKYALNSQTPALLVFERYIAGELEKNRIGVAKQVADRGTKYFSDKAHFLPEQVYITYLKTKDVSKTRKAMEDCLATNRDFMENLCYAAATGLDANFRDTHELILASINCKSADETGGDVLCDGDHMIGGKKKSGSFSDLIPSGLIKKLTKSSDTDTSAN